MLSIIKVGLTSEKALQGLFSWVCSLYPQPYPPFKICFNANILFYSACLRPVMIDIVPVQALSEWVLCGVLGGTLVAGAVQAKLISMEGEAFSFQLTATDNL